MRWLFVSCMAVITEAIVITAGFIDFRRYHWYQGIVNRNRNVT